ncbi:MAG: type VI secretion system baseplate subunit TssF, partial [Desulfovibrionaceae bacterium]|nr:type VI secretion system baseplate subunit TssF [Desulfovibrionaceae bacterium]
MISDYFQRELDLLRERGKSFSRRHPALAPMLSDEGTDPDVERLLEGTAYLSANIREKLDDQLPEIIHSLLNMVAPHYLRPVPSSTIISFTPRRALRECLTIRRGTLINSVEVDGTSCPFATCSDVEVAPLELSKVDLRPGRAGTGRLVLEFSTLNSLPLQAATGKSLRLYFTGAYADAARRLMLLCHHCRGLRLVPESARGAEAFTLPASSLHLAAFNEGEDIIPYPAGSFCGFRYLQEFFMMPERFCLVEILNFDRWTTRGMGRSFTLEVELGDLPDELPSFRTDHIRLFAAPAVNIFPMSGNPIRLDHRRDQYIIRPAGYDMQHYLVYSVDRVTGLRQGESTPREYQPFLAANPGSAPNPVYSLSTRLDEGSGLVVQLAVGRVAGQEPAPEVL